MNTTPVNPESKFLFPRSDAQFRTCDFFYNACRAAVNDHAVCVLNRVPSQGLKSTSAPFIKYQLQARVCVYSRGHAFSDSHKEKVHK